MSKATTATEVDGRDVKKILHLVGIINRKLERKGEKKCAKKKEPQRTTADDVSDMI